MPRLGDPAWEEVLAGSEMRLLDPGGDRLPGLLGDLELHRPVRLVLHDHGARQDRLALGDVQNTQAYQVTAAQVAIYGEIEQRQITGLSGELEPYSDCLDLFHLNRTSSKQGKPGG
jgi:hypothetical protein